MVDVKLEELIEKHRPREHEAGEPASGGHLFHLNNHRLLGKAMIAEAVKQHGVGIGTEQLRHVVVSKQTAWEVLSEAQRAGLRLTPPRGTARPSRV